MSVDKQNQFQYNEAVLYSLLKDQIGVTGTCPTSALTGYWENSPRTFSFEISSVCDLGSESIGRYVAIAKCDDGLELRCTASLLLRKDVHVAWRPANDMRTREEERNSLCHNAYMRAEEIAEALIAGRGPTCKGGNTVIMLDGDGSNRRAIQSTFDRACLPCPRIITFECDPVPALCQRILYGADIVYTPGDPFMCARRVNKEGDKSKKKQLLEDAIMQDRDGDTLGVDPSDVQLVYLDYCGGPPSDVDMTKVLSKFHNLLVYAGTMSTRQHPSLSERFENYIPTLYGFKAQKTRHSNKRVRCHLYRRMDISRSVSVPGWFWTNCPKHLKWKRFKGVMVTEHKACVLTERGQEIITLNSKMRNRFMHPTKKNVLV